MNRIAVTLDKLKADSRVELDKKMPITSISMGIWEQGGLCWTRTSDFLRVGQAL